MSWAASEWKDGLPTRALQKIEDMEQQLEKLKRERQQKQCQLDGLEQAIEKQKRKFEEDRLNQMSMMKEHKTLVDTCEELERKRLKLEHDLQTKDTHMSCLEGQLNHTKQALDAETAKVGQLKMELDKLQSTNLSLNSRADKMSSDCSRLQELSAHQRKQLDELREKMSVIQQDGTRGMNPRPVAVTSVVNGPDLLNIDDNQLVKCRQRIEELELLLGKSNDEKQSIATELQQLRESASQQLETANSAVGELSREKTQLLLAVDNKQLACSNRGEVERINVNELENIHSQQIIKMSTDIEGLRKNVETLKQQLQDSELKTQMADEKAKKMQLEVECHRHNSDAVRQSLEQKLKDKEKEWKAELSFAQDSLKDAENRLAQSAASIQRDANKNAAECESLRLQLDKSVQRNTELEKQLLTYSERIAGVDGLICEHATAVNKLQSAIDTLSNEKAKMLFDFEQRDNETLQLKKEINSLNEKLTLAGQTNDEIRGKMLEYQLELQSLDELQAICSKVDVLQAELDCQLKHSQESQIAYDNHIANLQTEIDCLRADKLTHSNDLEKAGQLTAALQRECEELKLQLDQAVVQKDSLESSSSKLTNELKSIQSENGELKVQLEALYMKCGHLEESLKLKAAEIAEIQLCSSNDRYSLCAEIERLTADKISHVSDIEKAGEMNAALQRECDELKSRLAGVVTMKDTLELSSSKLKSELEKVQFEKCNIQSDLEELSVKYCQLEESLKSKDAEVGDIQLSLSNQVSSLHAEIECLKAEKLTHSSDLEKSGEMNAALQRQCVELKSHLGEVVSLKDSLELSSSKLKTELEKVQFEKCNIQSDLEELSVKYCQLEESLKSKDAEVGDIQLSLSNQVSSLHAEIECLKAEKLTHSGDLEKSGEMNAALQRECEELKSHLGEVVSLKDSLELSSSKLKIELEKVQFEKCSIQSDLEELSVKYCQLEESLKSKDAEVGDIQLSLSNQVSSLHTEIECLKAEKLTHSGDLEKSGEMNAALQRECVELKSHLGEVVSLKDSLELSSSKLKTELEKVQFEKCNIQSDLEELSVKYCQLEESLKSKDAEVGDIQLSLSNQVSSLHAEIECLKADKLTHSSDLEKSGVMNAALQRECEELKSHLGEVVSLKDSLDLSSSKLKTELEKVQFEKCNIQSDLEELSVKYCQLKESLKSKDAEVGDIQLSLSNQVSSLHAEIECLKAEKLTHSGDLEKSGEMNAALQRECEELKSHLGEVVSLKDSLELSSSKLKIELEKVQFEKCNIQSDLEELSVKYCQLEESLKSKDAEVGDIQLSLSNQVSSLHAEIECLKAEKLTHSGDLEKSGEMNAALLRECVELKSHLGEVVSLKDSLELSSSKLKTELEKVQFEKCNIQSDLEELSVKYCQLEESLKSKDAEVGDIQLSLSNQVSSLHAEIECLKAEKLTHSSDLEKSGEMNAALQRQCVELKSHLGEVVLLKDSLDLSSSKLKTELEKVQFEKCNIQSDLEELSVKYCQLEESLKSKDAEVGDIQLSLSNQVSSLHAEIECLKAEKLTHSCDLEKSGEMNAALQRECEELKSHLGEVVSLKDSLDLSSSKLKTELEKVQFEKCNIQSDLEELSVKYCQLEESLKSKDAEVGDIQLSLSNQVSSLHAEIECLKAEKLTHSGDLEKSGEMNAALQRECVELKSHLGEVVSLKDSLELSSSKLKTELEKVQFEKCNIQSDLEELSVKYCQLEESLKSKDAEVGDIQLSLSNQVSSLHAEIECLKAEKLTHSGDLEKSGEMNAALQRECEELKSHLGEVVSLKDSLELSSSKLKIELEKVQFEKCSIQSDLEELSVKYCQLEESLKSKDAEVGDIQLSLSNQVSSLHAEIECLKAEKLTHSGDLEKSGEMNAALQRECVELKSHLGEVVSLKDSLELSSSKLKTELEKVQFEKCNIQSDLEELSVKYCQLEESLKSKDAEVGDIQLSLSNQVSSLHAEIECLKADKLTHSSDLEKSGVMNAALQRECEELKSHLGEVVSLKDSLDLSSSKLKTELEKVQFEKCNIQSDLEELSVKYCQLKESLKSKDAEVGDIQLSLSNQVSSLHAEIECLKAEKLTHSGDLEKSGEMNAALQRECEELKSHLGEVVSLKDSLELSSSKLKIELEKVQFEKCNIQSDLEELSVKYCQLEESLKSKDAEVGDIQLSLSNQVSSLHAEIECLKAEKLTHSSDLEKSGEMNAALQRQCMELKSHLGEVVSLKDSLDLSSSKLKTELEKVQFEKCNIQSDLEELSVKYCQLEESLKSKDAEVGDIQLSLSNQVSSLHAEIECLKAEKLTHSCDLEKSGEMNAALQRECEELKSHLGEVVSLKDSLDLSSSKLKTELEKVQFEKCNIQSDLEELSVKYCQLEESLKSKDAEVGDIQLSLSNQVSSLHAEIECLKAEKLTHSGDLEKSGEMNAALQRECVELKSHLGEVVSLKDSLELSSSKLKTELEKVQFEKCNIQSDLEELSVKYCQLEESLKSKDAEVGDIQLSLSNQVSSLHAEIECLKAEKLTHSGDLEKSGEMNAALQRECVELKSHLGEVVSLKDSLELSSSKLKTELEKVQFEKCNIQSDLEELSVKYCQLEESLKSKDAEVGDIQLSLSNQVSSLHAEIECLKADKLTHSSDLEKSGVMNAALQRECVHLKSQFDDVIVRKDSLESSCSKLRAELESTQIENGELKIQLEALHMKCGHLGESLKLKDDEIGDMQTVVANKVSCVQAEIECMTSERVSFGDIIRCAEDKNIVLEHERDELSAQLQLTVEKCDLVQQLLNAKCDLVGQLESKLHDADVTQSELASECECLRQQVHVTDDSAGDSLKAVEEIERLNNALLKRDEDYAALKCELEGVLRDVDCYEQEKTELLELHATCTKNTEQVWFDLTEELRKKDDEIAKLINCCRNLEIEVAEFSSNLTIKDLKLSELSANVDLLNARNKELSDERLALKETAEAANNEKLQVQYLLESSMCDLKQKDGVVEGLETALTAERKKMETLRADVDSSREDQLQLEAEIIRINQAKEELGMLMRDFEEKASSCETRCEHLKLTLDQKMVLLDEEISRNKDLEEHLKQLERNISAIEQESNSRVEENERLHTEIDKLAADKETLEKYLASMQFCLEQSQSKSDELTTCLNDCQNKLHVTENELQSREAALVSLRDCVEGAKSNTKSEVDDVLQKLDVCMEEKDAIICQLEEVIKCRDSLQVDIDNVSEQLESVRNSLSAAVAENRLKDETIKKQICDFDDVSKRVVGLHEVVKSLEGELKYLDQHKIESENQIKALNKSQVILEGKLSDEVEKRMEEQNLANDLRLELENMHQHNEVLVGKIAALEALANQQSDSRSSLQSEKCRLEQDSADWHAARITLELTISDLQGRVAQLDTWSHKVSSLEAEIERLVADKVVKSNDLEKACELNVTLQRECEGLRAECERLVIKRDSLLSISSQLKFELESTQSQNMDLKAQLEALSTKCSQLAESLKLNAAEIIEARLSFNNEKSSLQAEIDRLMAEKLAFKNSSEQMNAALRSDCEVWKGQLEEDVVKRNNLELSCISLKTELEGVKYNLDEVSTKYNRLQEILKSKDTVANIPVLPDIPGSCLQAEIVHSRVQKSTNEDICFQQQCTEKVSLASTGRHYITEEASVESNGSHTQPSSRPAVDYHTVPSSLHAVTVAPDLTSTLIHCSSGISEVSESCSHGPSVAVTNLAAATVPCSSASDNAGTSVLNSSRRRSAAGRKQRTIKRYTRLATPVKSTHTAFVADIKQPEQVASDSVTSNVQSTGHSVCVNTAAAGDFKPPHVVSTHVDNSLSLLHRPLPIRPVNCGLITSATSLHPVSISSKPSTATIGAAVAGGSQSAFTSSISATELVQTAGTVSNVDTSRSNSIESVAVTLVSDSGVASCNTSTDTMPTDIINVSGSGRVLRSSSKRQSTDPDLNTDAAKKVRPNDHQDAAVSRLPARKTRLASRRPTGTAAKTTLNTETAQNNELPATVKPLDTVTNSPAKASVAAAAAEGADVGRAAGSRMRAQRFTFTSDTSETSKVTSTSTAARQKGIITHPRSKDVEGCTQQ